VLVWLNTVGEPLPTDPASPRLLRTGLLADQLWRRGHEVVWWTSTFDHVRKVHRATKSATVRLRDRYELRLLHGPGYQQNVSLRRWLNHWMIGREFARWARKAPVPDVILCSLPNLELAREAVRYGRERAVPVALDLRDMWPDIFLDVLPAVLRPIVKPALRGPVRDLEYACRGAAALTGISPEFIAWGARAAGRPPGPLDRHFWLASPSATPAQAALKRAEARWRAEGIEPGRTNPVLCFFGAMSRTFEMHTVIEAAAQLERESSPIRFVLCGVGDTLPRLRRLAAGLGNILFPGWVNAAEAWVLLRASLAGLAPYRSRDDFRASIPTKTIEYLSAGLPILSSLRGSLEHLVERERVGLTYRNADPADLVTKSRRLLEAPEERLPMARNAVALYEREFVAERVYNDMARYLEIVAGARSD
jgi:glycosyltransferase involved in cell wall biosynthesis